MGQIDWTTADAASEQAAQKQLEAARQNILSRRAALRMRQRRQWLACTATGMALTFCLGFGMGAATTGSREHSPTAPSAPTANTAMELTQIRATAQRYIALAPDAALAIVAPPEYRAPQAPAKLLDSVPLDAETQAAIFTVCGEDPELFAAVMAIAAQESDFDPDTIGDNGNSIGMMQINTKWQTERVKALGITDLTDPVQSATVAVDYLRELSEDYNLGWVHDHSLYMGYNMGPGGAKRALRNGAASSAYSREVLPAFEGYLAEMEEG